MSALSLGGSSFFMETPATDEEDSLTENTANAWNAMLRNDTVPNTDSDEQDVFNSMEDRAYVDERTYVDDNCAGIEKSGLLRAALLSSENREDECDFDVGDDANIDVNSLLPRTIKKQSSGGSRSSRGSKRKRAKLKAQKAGDGEVFHSAIFGVINTVIAVPSMVGFAAIIYRDPFFSLPENHHVMPSLLKLVLLSSSIHQLCFMLMSSMPFAVAQVQDAGLIFLSSMSGMIIAKMLAQGVTDYAAIVATVVVTLSVSTAALGVMLIITGKMKLAGLVQYLPLPVIGGYLAFIGLYCGEAGLSLMAGTPGVEGISGWLAFFSSGHNWVLMAPGLLCAVLLNIVVRVVKHQLALPFCLVLIPVCFYLILAFTGTSLQEARDFGWVAQDSTKVAADLAAAAAVAQGGNATEAMQSVLGASPPAFYHIFDVFDFSKVHWSAAFPQVIPTFLAMYAVVAFGSCLDVAAIQYDSGQMLDYNHELKTVGWSNVVSGVMGGYTGSYIFSQTLFSLRNRVTSRVNGLFIVITEMALVLLPLDVVAYVPRFYFGCVMLFVSVEILTEWLVHSYHKLEKREYALIWGTFVAICFSSLEAGMLMGGVVAALNFVHSYSQTTTVEVVSAHSDAVRGHDQRVLLAKSRRAIVVVKLHGYQFFGSTLKVTSAIQSQVTIRVPDAEYYSQNEPGAEEYSSASSQLSRSRSPINMAGMSALAIVRGDSNGVPEWRQQQRKQFRRLGTAEERNVRGDLFVRDLRGLSLTPNLRRRVANYFPTTATPLPHRGSNNITEPQEVGALPTRFVVIDCSEVSAIDATSARSCFLTLRQILESHGIQIVFVNLKSKAKRLLHAHGVLPSMEKPKPVNKTDEEEEDEDEDEEVEEEEYEEEDNEEEEDDDHEQEQQDDIESGRLLDTDQVRRESTMADKKKMKASRWPVAFDSLDEALEWCEDIVIHDAMILDRMNKGNSTQPDSEEHIEQEEDITTIPNTDAEISAAPFRLLHNFLSGKDEQPSAKKINALSRLGDYFERLELGNNAVLFDVGSAADAVYLIEKGQVTLNPVNPLVEGAKWHHIQRKHVLRYMGGGMVGEIDFFLNEPRTFCAMVHLESEGGHIILHRLTRDRYDEMCELEPHVAVVFQDAIVKSMAVSSKISMHF